MYFAGLAGEPRHYAQLTGLNPPAQHLLGSTGAIQVHITVGAFALGLTQLLFLINLVLTLRLPPISIQNFWQATTMEWSPQAFNENPDNPPVVYHRPCHYSDDGATFTPQWSL